MKKKTDLPFKVGELVEARSFQIGFRGAWFRCKIREITKRQGRLMHLLEYYDFPDEKLKWLRLYQVPPYPLGKAKEKKRELMVRPQYPEMYNESQIRDGCELSVGDLVEWWSDGCYWCGKITQILGDDKGQIELKAPPVGEGSIYQVFLKDVRPSLDWSPEQGWTTPPAPTPPIIKSLNQEEVKDMKRLQVDRGKSFALNSARSDTMEAAIMDLEEYLNKVKWLKNVLQFGISSSRPHPQFMHSPPNP